MTKTDEPKKQETEKKKSKKPDDDEPISLYPLSLEEALKKIMDVKVPPSNDDQKQ
jgi:hypothetical protein